jgi:TolB-like protein/DNA-binding winged helix-turn-helix (wHTH) protein/Flp pilus assembly protein TadD
MKRPVANSFFIDDWRVSPPEGLLARGTEMVRLEPKAMEVLVYFASRPGEVITREELEREVWHGALVGYDAVTNTVIKLRKALQDNARQPRFIATIPKMGYQLIAPIAYPEGDKRPESASPAASESVAVAEVPGKRPSWPVPRTGWAMAALVGVLVIGLVWLWPVVTFSTASVAPADSNSSVVLPSIVVLLFENLSHDPKQDYLADGITEDIITDLSRLSSVRVIASNTSLAYKGRQVLVEDVGTDLNVGFVLKGSIQRLGDSVRVNAQLVDAKTGFNVWAQRFDRKISEVFAVQDEVTRSIVNALAVKVTYQEKSRLAQRATDSLKAYDLFQEGQRISKGRTQEDDVQARDLYQKAIEPDPTYGRAYGAMAVSLAFDYQRGWTDTPIETLDRALVLAKQAVALDDSTPQTYWALSFVYLMRKEYSNAEKAVTRALSIAPNYADGYGLLALIKMYVGQPKRAIELNAKAMRLNPYFTLEYLYNQGVSYYMLGDYDAAIKALEQAHERNQNQVNSKLFLAASYVQADRQDDAEWMAVQIQMLDPTATLSTIEKTIPIENPESMRAFLADLRKAGLPE